MDFRILGPLEVQGDDGPVALGGAKQRALLAILLLNANQVVSSDRLIDELWGEEPPETAAKGLQGYVSGLRKALDGGDVLVTRPPGYAIEVEPGQFDLARFEQLRANARRALAGGDPGGASIALQRHSRYGAARPSRTWPTSRSRRPRSPTWRTCDWQRSRSGSKPTWRSGDTPTSPPSWSGSRATTHCVSGCAVS